MFNRETLSRIFVTSVFVGLLVFAPFAYAAPSYTVSPLVIDVKAEARDIKTYEITLTNTGTQPVTVYPSVNNISVDAGGTIEKFLGPAMDDRQSSLASWIEISRRGISLAEGESKSVTMTLRIHPFPKPGEYHALIGFGHGRNQYVAMQQVKKGAAPGTVVSVNIAEERTELLRLSRFLIDRFVTSADNEDASYVINNPGDTDLVPAGEIIFYNNRGAEVASAPVNPNGEIVPPGKEKRFSITVPTEGLFGKYKAFLSVEYGSSQIASVQDTAFFYVMPYRTLFMILGGLIVLVILISWYIHRKYFDEAETPDSEYLHLHIKETPSEPKDHDIDLKQNE